MAELEGLDSNKASAIMMENGAGMHMKRERQMNGQWKPGQPLTKEDQAILAPLIARARELGRSPKVGEVSEAARIKARFRIWKYALMAAGLPVMNDPEQVRAREKEKMKNQ